MAALTQPTGSILCPTFSGEVTTVGTLTATKIDAIIANEPTTNPVTMAFTHIVSLVGTDLDTTQYPFAYRALIAACKYDLLEWDRLEQEAIPNAQGGGILIESYQDKMARYANQVGENLLELGIYSSNYKVYPQCTATTVGGAHSVLHNSYNYNDGTDC